MNEIWKDIKGYERYYQISNFGRIKSLKRIIQTSNNINRTIKEKILKNVINPYGYYYIDLSRNNKGCKFFVHVLVAREFIKNTYNKPEVNHKDGDKENNHIDNLEWATRVENQKHAWKTGLHKNHNGERNPKHKLKEKEVIEIKKELKNYNHGLCEILAKRYNVHSATIRFIKQNRRWKHVKI